MRSHLAYLRYVLRHKWHVFVAGWHLSVPLWQLLIHDWTKFLPREWFPYVAYFYGRGGREAHAKSGGMYRPGSDFAFDIAWNHHQKRNPHHWQYWLLTRDTDEPQLIALPMPERYVREMVADWIGAGAAQGKPDNWHWYLTNREKMNLHPETRQGAELLLMAAEIKGLIPPRGNR